MDASNIDGDRTLPPLPPPCEASDHTVDPKPPTVRRLSVVADADSTNRPLAMPGGHIDDRASTTFSSQAPAPNPTDFLYASLRLPSLFGLGFDAQRFTPARETPGDDPMTASSSAVETDDPSSSVPRTFHTEPDRDDFELIDAGGPRDDYFAYHPPRRRRMHWSARPRSKHRSSLSKTLHGDANAESNDETWSIIDEPMGAVENGASDYFSTSHSQSINKTLHELDEVEINEFLRHFSRHTREVHLPGAARHFKRMPKWTDFAFSSDEDEEQIVPFAPSELLADRHRRSRLLLHVDRGLHKLETSSSTSDDAATLPSEPEAVLPGTEPEVRRAHLATSGQDPFQSAPRRLNLTPTDFDAPLPLPPEEEGDDSVPLPRKHMRIRAEDTEVPPRWNDEHVDGVAYCIAYLLALVEQYAPDDLDEAPITEYRESRARSHIERLYIIAPFWEQLATNLRALYSWEDPRRTAGAAMVYFVLWQTDLLPAAFFLTLLYYVLQFRYFPQDESLLHQRVHERMVRGQHANRMAERLKRRSRLDILDLYKRWASSYGVVSQVFTGDVADFHEKIKNLLLWRNPRASQRTAFLLLILVVITTVCNPALVLKMFFFGCGFTFFALMPLQTLYPRYRRALNPLWWAVLGAPTDGQWAVQLLQQRHARYQELLHAPGSAWPGATDVPPSPGADDARFASKREAAAVPAAPVLRDGTQVMDTRKLNSFLCQHHGVPGHLVVTSTHMYFTPLRVVTATGKHYVTKLEDIIGMRKTHHNRLWVWESHGLKILRRDKNALSLSNMAHRDEAFNLLLTLASQYMHHP